MLTFFQDLVEISPDLLWQCDAEGVWTYLNPAWEIPFGFKPAEMLGRKICDFQPPEFANRHAEAFSRVRRGETLKGFEVVLLSKSGQKMHLIITAKPILAGDGLFLGALGTALNVSAQHQAEKEMSSTCFKETEDALRESEDRYKIIFLTCPDPLSITAIDGTFLEINEGFSQFFGHTHDEVIGRTALELKIWPNPEARKEMVATLMTHGRFTNFEADFRRKDGSLKSTLMSGSIVKIRNIPHILMTIHDISARKQLERELKESATRYRMIIELAVDAFFHGDAKGNFIEVNTRAIELTGYSREELLRLNMKDLFSADALKHAPLRYDLVDTGQAVASQRELRTKDGRIRQIEMHSKRMPDGTYQAFFHDITVRKQAEEAIANEKERLSVTLRSIGDGVITTDIHGRIHLLNRVAEHLTGWTQQEAQDRPLTEVFHIIDERSRESVPPPAGKVLASTDTVEPEIPTLLVARDGSERLISSCGSPIMDQNNSVIGIVLVFRDMTEKTKLLEISQNNQKLEALGVLAGGIAHDFNNLLGGIFGFMELAFTECHEPTVANFLNNAMATIKRARSLTQQLLTFAKGGTPVRTVAPLFPFLRQSAQFALSGSNVSCRCQVPDGLWPCNIDTNQIGQVIDNLVINAQQAMPMGGEILLSAVNLTLENQASPGLPAGNYVRVSITDTGIGIPRDILPRIFDPFFTTKSKGHGLGLATSHSILRRHNGAITVESEPGKGSTFHIFLPASPGNSAQADKATQVRHVGQGRFLIMDDEKTVRDILAAFLQNFGYQVVAMADGRSALDYFLAEHQAGRHFAGIVLDLTVPGGLGGKDIIANLRAVAPDLPIIVFSGYAEDPIMASPAKFGFTASLRKPFLRCELEDVLVRHIQVHDS